MTFSLFSLLTVPTVQAGPIEDLCPPMTLSGEGPTDNCIIDRAVALCSQYWYAPECTPEYWCGEVTGYPWACDSKDSLCTWLTGYPSNCDTQYWISEVESLVESLKDFPEDCLAWEAYGCKQVMGCVNNEPGSLCAPVHDCVAGQPTIPCDPNGIVEACLAGALSGCNKAVDCMNGEPGSPCAPVHDCVAGQPVLPCDPQGFADLCLAGADPCEPVADCLAGQPIIPCDPDPKVLVLDLPTSCEFGCEVAEFELEPALGAEIDVPDAYLVDCLIRIPFGDTWIKYKITTLSDTDACLPGTEYLGSTPVVTPDPNGIKREFVNTYVVGECDFQILLEVYGAQVGITQAQRIPCVFPA